MPQNYFDSKNPKSEHYKIKIEFEKLIESSVFHLSESGRHDLFEHPRFWDEIEKAEKNLGARLVNMMTAERYIAEYLSEDYKKLSDEEAKQHDDILHKSIESDPVLFKLLKARAKKKEPDEIDSSDITLNKVYSTIGMVNIQKIIRRMIENSMRVGKKEVYGINSDSFLIHVLLIAYYLQSMYDHLPRDLMEELNNYFKNKKSLYIKRQLYFTGLLHDYGKIILNQGYEKVHEKILMEFKESENPESFYEIEKKTIGIDHTDLANVILKKMGLEDAVIEAIYAHHEPIEKGKRFPQLCKLVFWVNNLFVTTGLKDKTGFWIVNTRRLEDIKKTAEQMDLEDLYNIKIIRENILETESNINELLHELKILPPRDKFLIVTSLPFYT